MIRGGGSEGAGHEIMAPNHRNEILKAVTEVFDEAS
jgi:hypothetical protein